MKAEVHNMAKYDRNHTAIKNYDGRISVNES